uniref:Uncharacterized protein n=2 Tax=Acrobeloides nanus TaxID=290746 RepID=A0A914CQJ6_9BILA
EELFREIITKDAYKSLPVESRNYLKRFFPKNHEPNEEEQILDGIFSTDPKFHFGNTIVKMHSKLKAGFFDPDRSSELNNNRKVLYDHYIRHYYMSLLKKLLISRHAIFDQECNIGAGDNIDVDPFRFQIVKKKASKRAIQDRARTRAKRMIQDCKTKVSEAGSSSDDTEEEENPNLNVPTKSYGQSTMYSPTTSKSDLDLHQPVYTKSVKEMLREYRYLKEVEPDCPSLDITDITLEEVYERSGISYQSEKNFATSNRKRFLPIHTPDAAETSFNNPSNKS